MSDKCLYCGSKMTEKEVDDYVDLCKKCNDRIHPKNKGFWDRLFDV
jgi:DNA-directed RNA polymerase subunit RPC12/RpoP